MESLDSRSDSTCRVPPSSVRRGNQQLARSHSDGLPRITTARSMKETQLLLHPRLRFRPSIRTCVVRRGSMSFCAVGSTLREPGISFEERGVWITKHFVAQKVGLRPEGSLWQPWWVVRSILTCLRQK